MLHSNWIRLVCLMFFGGGAFPNMRIKMKTNSRAPPSVYSTKSLHTQVNFYTVHPGRICNYCMIWKYQWVQSTTVAHPQSHMHFQPNSPLFDNLSNVIDKWNIPTNDFYSLVVWYFSYACASVCLSPCACVCVCVKHGFYDTRSRLFIFLDMFACFVSLLVRFPQKTHVLWFSFPYSIRLFLVGGCFFVSQKAMFKYVSLCIWTVVAVCVGVFHMLN